jgi:hypothetical protein
MSEEVKLDWSSAEVEDGTLTIALEGKLEKDWKAAFARTTGLLNRGGWEEVTLKKGKILVRTITPGDEDRIRHFLEGVVLQANSYLDTPDEENDDQTTGEDGASQTAESKTPEDQEMTERLRGFADARTE